MASKSFSEWLFGPRHYSVPQEQTEEQKAPKAEVTRGPEAGVGYNQLTANSRKPNPKTPVIRGPQERMGYKQLTAKPASLNPATPVTRGPQAGVGYAQLTGQKQNTAPQTVTQVSRDGSQVPAGGQNTPVMKGATAQGSMGIGSQIMPEPPVQSLATDTHQASAAARQQTGNTALSIVDYLASKGLDHSLASRRAMAQQYGIDTSNSYNMNVALLKQLQANEERKSIKYGDKKDIYQAQQLNAAPINVLSGNKPVQPKDQAIYDLIAQFKKGGCVKKKPKKCAEGTKVTKSGCGSKVEKNKCGGKAKKK